MQFIEDLKVRCREFRVEIAVTVLSFSFVLFKILWDRPLKMYSDENGYLFSAADIIKNGFFTKWIYSNLKTYIYPMFIVAVQKIFFGIKVDETLWITLMAFQFILYVWAAWFVSRRFPLARLATFAVLVLNIWNLIYVTAILTETFSLVFILLSIWALTCPKKNGFLIGILLGGAIMVRPANVFVLAPLTLMFAIDLWKSRSITWTVPAILAMILISLPQLINNIVSYNQTTPLVASSLGSAQIEWGLKVIKYGTGIQGGNGSQILYKNPLVTKNEVESGQLSLQWYFQNPVRGVGVVAIKIFNLLDQDLPCPYNQELKPWFRWPLTLLNHVVLALGFLGLFRAFKMDAHNREFSAICLAFIISGAALYSVTAVEARFGLPFLTIATLYLPRGYSDFKVSTARWKTASFLLYLLCALTASALVQSTIASDVKLY